MGGITSDQLSAEGCAEMFGAHVALCISDYSIKSHIEALIKLRSRIAAKINKVKRGDGFLANKLRGKLQAVNFALYNFETAENYIFGECLEEQIQKLGLPLEITAIRRRAIAACADKTKSRECVMRMLKGDNDDTN